MSNYFTKIKYILQNVMGFKIKSIKDGVALNSAQEGRNKI